MNAENRNALAANESDSKDLADGLIESQSTADAVRCVLNGQQHPHNLPAILHDLWRDGFRAGNNAAQIRVTLAEREANYWWVASKWTPKQIADLQRDASLEGKRIDWHRGVIV